MLLLFLLIVFPSCAPAQIISTIAGNGGFGYNGDGIPAISAELNAPAGVAADEGNIFIADQDNNLIRKIDASGIITTIAGDGTAGESGAGGPANAAQIGLPTCVAVDDSGNVYFNDGFSVI
jgi:hypothetical protein